MSEITLVGNLTETHDYGVTLKFSAYTEDAKLQFIRVIYEMYDTVGAAWLGPQVTVEIDSNHMVMTLLDGGTKEFPAINYNTVAVQAKLDRDSIGAFIQAQGGDLRVTP